MNRRSFAGALAGVLAAIGFRPASLAGTTPGRTTPVRLGRGIYLHEASGPTAYLGTIVTVIDSHGLEPEGRRGQRLSCHIAARANPEYRARCIAHICAELDRVDPPRAVAS
jgi:hypothetical protein